ncbi:MULTISPECIES: response regulator [unclassified Paenibacillus]|uniref:Response regulator n=1 Tax=Paenibacillus provencensis TaxID=441151 RepID=A0ABW3PS12_9BACL|nr:MULTISPECIES: response regulator [unclassified Paenibacillus]MCM3130097.1 response regulator [Paenibacillus sp. MER 78]SFS61907.1 Two-component response regulator, SAPR family, consists of REC, wHTH and BTAD domains [Paenibacillus sp. 453mf]
MLQAVIVDDEELSINRLKRLLTDNEEIEVCRTYLNPKDALEYIEANHVDIVFLDISMPELNGMELSKYLKHHNDSIEVVFVTGYDEYAVQAFEISALDYLLKPVTAQRVEVTLNKIRRTVSTKIQEKRLTAETTDLLLKVEMFDGFKVYQSNHQKEWVKLRSPKTEELFAFLLHKRTVSRDEIIDTLWKNFEPEKAWKNLNSTLYYIRQAINGCYKGASVIQATRNEIRIDVGYLSCDIYEFDRLMKQQSNSRIFEIEQVESAMKLYTGPFLKGKTYEWASSRGLELEQDYMKMLEYAAKYYRKTNHSERSLYFYEEMIRIDAFREDIGEELIKMYLELGREKEALRFYQNLEDLYKIELGTEPVSSIKKLISSLV